MKIQRLALLILLLSWGAVYVSILVGRETGWAIYLAMTVQVVAVLVTCTVVAETERKKVAD